MASPSLIEGTQRNHPTCGWPSGRCHSSGSVCFCSWQVRHSAVATVRLTLVRRSPCCGGKCAGLPVSMATLSVGPLSTGVVEGKAGQHSQSLSPYSYDIRSFLQMTLGEHSHRTDMLPLCARFEMSIPIPLLQFLGGSALRSMSGCHLQGERQVVALCTSYN